MNEYLSRSDIAPVDRITRTTPVVSGVQSVIQTSATSTAPTAVETKAVANANADLSSASEEQLASAAEYARIHASIADILSNIRSSSTPATTTVDDSESAIVSLLPPPVIIVPLPPASRDMVERAEMLAKYMADQAVTSRAAQAHLKPGTVDQILATAA